ncbi:ATP-binding protein [Pseudomonas sp. SA3-5]|uniref:histidine kinase n=1 Tax=Pseudomonas aestuarii TaxID=3018340 RepID=A0ABT4XD39_9PSED|nr:ATP-binding protein [Pseudomonas aestuarii]MDA7086100.1 ATP-binding protein [Pseudomonas aestuarii]
MSRKPLSPWLAALLVWLGLSLGYAYWLLGEERVRTFEAFETQSRILHRLLTQRAEQHEAILAALVAAERSLGTSTALFESFAGSLQRSYPQIVGIERYRREPTGRWTRNASQASPALAAVTLESLPALSGQARLWVLADDPEHYRLLRSSPTGTLYAIRIARARLLQPEELPAERMTAQLTSDDGLLLWQVVAQASRWSDLTPLLFRKTLGSHSQPFQLATEQSPMPERLPWLRLAIGIVTLLSISLLCCWAFAQYRHSSIARRQLALAQASRINSMGELAAGIAHELNQPLAAILANSQALAHFMADDPVDLSGAQQAAGNLARQAKRAGAIVHRLRQFLSPKADRVEPVDLRGVVEDALALTQATLRRQQIKVKTALSSGLPTVLGDAVAFEQVLVNLLLNAAEAMSECAERRLDIHLTQEGQVLRLEIADSGPGLSTEAAARLFEPFYTTKPGGLGLGLTLCASIIEQAGGRLTVEPSPAGGCRFSVILPVATQVQRQ